MTDPRKSKRFIPSSWSRWLVPATLGFLLLLLLLTLVLVGLSILGLTPGA
jgi:hypothetical protein